VDAAALLWAWILPEACAHCAVGCKDIGDVSEDAYACVMFVCGFEIRTCIYLFCVILRVVKTRES